jgi:SAM-dependent methyltransferase
MSVRRKTCQNNPFITCADEYDRWLESRHDLFLKQTAFIRPFLKPGDENILEVGCGSGRFSYTFGIPRALAPSPPLSKMAFQWGVRIICGDGEMLPIRTGILSQVFLITVLEFVGNPVQVLYEIHRSLTPGESLIVVSLYTDCETGRKYRKKTYHL